MVTDASLQSADKPKELGRSGSVVRSFNVKFSPNLVVVLLLDCIEKALIDLGADPDTHSIDLAARKAYGDVMMGRGTVMTFLDALPPTLRRAAVRLPLKAQSIRSWRPHFARGLEGADRVVIGGGNLISDIDLNFPTKLGLAISEAERRNLPTAFYACGVAQGWSATGLKMCRAAFARPHVRAVFLRDTDSKVLWDDLMSEATGITGEVVRDPGLMAADLYPQPPRPRDRRPVAGLGLMSHIAIRYHATDAPRSEHLGRWYLDVARGLIEQGCEVRVFTNGSPEDKAYAAQMHDRLAALGSSDQISFLTQRDPRGLCAHIADFDVLIAYRMHAVIAAYAYGVPAIALSWDRKLRSFMASVNREEFLLDVAKVPAGDCVDMAIAAARDGLPEAERAAVVAEARADVARMWAVLEPEGRMERRA